MDNHTIDFRAEYNSLRSKFNSTNYPELNKRISCYFFFYLIQETYPKIWKTLNLNWQIVEIEKINQLIRNKKLPKEFDENKMSSEIMGYIRDYESNGSNTMQFLPIIPLRKPNHPEFWRSYIDDTRSETLLQIFDQFVSLESKDSKPNLNAVKEDIEFRKSLSKYK